MLPNFFLIGAMKAGTTSLHQYLRSHPDVVMARKKELHFFSDDSNYQRGRRWYEGWFVEADREGIAIGESSTSYSKFPEHPEVPARIADLVPRARFIYLVRHPIERMRSEYVHHVAGGQETRPIDEALLADARYVNNSRYALQIDQYLQHFPPEDLLVVTSEDLRDARALTLRRVYGFLGVDERWVPPTIDREFYRSEERRGIRPMALRAKRIPGARAAARLRPTRLKRITRQLLTRELPGGDIRIPDDVRQELCQMLSEDLHRLRLFLGGRFDAWGLI